jgi:hypothetical protein
MFFFMAELISVQPELQEEDLVTAKLKRLWMVKPDAIVIRTLPNLEGKAFKIFEYQSALSGGRCCAFHSRKRNKTSTDWFAKCW